MFIHLSPSKLNFVLFSFFVVVVFLFSYMLGPWGYVFGTCLADVRVLSAKAFICTLLSTL